MVTVVEVAVAVVVVVVMVLSWAVSVSGTDLRRCVAGLPRRPYHRPRQKKRPPPLPPPPSHRHLVSLLVNLLLRGRLHVPQATPHTLGGGAGLLWRRADARPGRLSEGGRMSRNVRM